MEKNKQTRKVAKTPLLAIFMQRLQVNPTIRNRPKFILVDKL